jgi:hypothetical protein
VVSNAQAGHSDASFKIAFRPAQLGVHRLIVSAGGCAEPGRRHHDVAVAPDSRIVLPFKIASRFQGAPIRIHRCRCLKVKRAVWLGCSVRSKTVRPAAELMWTDSQQGPRDATSTIRETVALRLGVRRGRGAGGVVACVRATRGG